MLPTSNGMKSAIIWGGVILILIVTIFGVVKLAKAPVSGTGGTIPEVGATDQTRGPKDAKVVLVEYSDFQCPACKSFFPIMENLGKELGGEFIFVYRHFPLPQHKNAELSAYASEAAGEQGKFWEMYAMIFEKQNEWAESGKAKDLFIGYAQSMNLEIESFKNNMDSNEVKDKVSADQRGGVRARVNSTPTFFLNGKKMEGYNSYDDFAKQVREAIRNNS